jgi:hypothetical protein
MNKYKTILDEIAKIVGVEIQQSENQKVEFAKATLKDGTTILFEGELAEGIDILVSTPDGDVPAPDGVHTLEDGTEVETAGGKVVKITAPKAEEVEQPEAEQPVQQNDELIARIDTLESIVKELADKVNGQTEVQQKIQKVLQKLSEEPINEPVTKTEQVNNSTQTNHPVEQYFKGNEAKQLGIVFKAINKK